MTIERATLDQAFRVAAAELGMCDAAWRFADEVEAVGGAQLVEEVREALGRTFPVLDAVFAQRLEGQGAPVVDPGPVADACVGLKRLVLIGLEARWVDGLLARLPGVEFGLIPAGALPGDSARMMSNLPPGVRLLSVDEFQRFAGPRSGLLTFLYGAGAATGFVLPEWVRCQGPDVRAQFHSFVGWVVLPAAPDVYPRWLVEVALDSFTAVIGS